MNQSKIKQLGSVAVVMLLGGVSTVILGAVVMLAANTYDRSRRQIAQEQALSIAEAGAHYYRWHLAHHPTDYQDGIGHAGPYVHEYKDPQGAVVGYYSLMITPPTAGFSIVTIESTGWTTELTSIKRMVKVRYGLPSFARYSFLHNSSAWFGQGLTVHGRVLSNGGIRQDGVNDSLIQSAMNTYTCGQETGCSPSRPKPGVWGSGVPSTLWQFPVAAEDFNSINVDFQQMKTAAQANSTYFGSTTGYGYHLIFNATGTVTVRKVTSVNYYRGYDTDSGCSNLYERIVNENNVGTYALTNNSVFLFEHNLWVEGTMKGKATIAAARAPFDSSNMDIWIRGNLTYVAHDGNNNLGLIAQRNIYFVKDLPNDFKIDGALLAQRGKIMRSNYDYCTGYSNAVRNSLTIFGSVISGQKSYWNWGSGSPPSSGFVTRDVSYDSNLRLIPPPYFPASGDYEVIDWEEQNHN
jgi:hypothetical protein